MTFKTTKAILFAALMMATIIVISEINPVNAEQSDKKIPTKTVIMAKNVPLQEKGNLTVGNSSSTAPNSVRPLSITPLSNSAQIRDSCVNGAPLYTMSYSGYFYAPTQNYYLTWDFPPQVAQGTGINCTTIPYGGYIALKIGDGSTPQNYCYATPAEPRTVTTAVQFTCTAFTATSGNLVEIKILGLYGTSSPYQGYGFDDWYIAN